MRRMMMRILCPLFLLLAFSACSTSDIPVQEPYVIGPAPSAAPAAALVPVDETGSEPHPAADSGSLSMTVTEISRYGNVYADMLCAVFLDSFSTGDVVLVETGDISFEAPVVTSYSDVDSGMPLVKVDGEFVELALSYADLAGTYAIGDGDVITVSMASQGAYLTQYGIRHLERSENRADYTDDDVFANFRALSGGNLKENFLYRSCNPALDDSRAIYADYLAEVAGIRTVVNLADSEESLAATMDPSSYYAELYEGGHVILLNMGVDFRQADFASRLGEGLEFIIANPQGPVLIHCNEGKDRAGMVCALLKALAGASMDEIVSDYMKSYENYYNVEPGSSQWNEISRIITDFFQEIGTDSSRDAKSAAVYYLTTQAGLSEAQLSALEEIITN